MRFPILKILLVPVLLGLVVSGAEAGSNKRIMSISAAKVVAERNLVETIYGLKLRASESVENMVAANFTAKTETKTSATISGVGFDEIQYDKERDIARAIARVSLPNITNIDGTVIDFKGKTFRRIGFGTSSPESAGPLKAMRAAEIDAYKQMMKRLVGFTLESETSVENFMLKSDVIRTKVMATLFMAEVVDYGWDESGDAHVKMSLNLKNLAELLGQKIKDAPGDVFEVVGLGAQEGESTPAPSFPTPALAPPPAATSAAAPTTTGQHQ